MTASDISPQAVTAAGNALRRRWLEQHPGIAALGLDPMDWARTALEAAAPHLAAAGPVIHMERDLSEAEAAELREKLKIALRTGRPQVLPDDTGERIAEAVAAERERIIALAESVKAVATADEGTQCYFADLLRQDGST